MTSSSDAAMAAGNRCGDGCDSSTIVPAVIYFPSGTYKISAPIVSWYYTQMTGDAKNIPVIMAAPNFAGMAMIGESSLQFRNALDIYSYVQDADPYTQNGQWYINQNNVRVSILSRCCA
jgi:glucan 1,3-beta-glucosidase